MSAPKDDTNVITFENGSVVSGFESMGRLVKALAEAAAAENATPMPKTWGELETFIKHNELGIAIKGTGYRYDNGDGDGGTDSSYKKLDPSGSISIVSYDANYQARIMVPASKDMELSASEKQSGGYPLPDFYSQLAFDGQPKNITDAEKFLLHRIGEYTTQKCR